MSKWRSVVVEYGLSRVCWRSLTFFLHRKNITQCAGSRWGPLQGGIDDTPDARRSPLPALKGPMHSGSDDTPRAPRPPLPTAGVTAWRRLLPSLPEALTAADNVRTSRSELMLLLLMQTR